MNNLGWWEMFANYGTVETYLLYRAMLRTEEEQNGRGKDSGADSVSNKFE